MKTCKSDITKRLVTRDKMTTLTTRDKMTTLTKNCVSFVSCPDYYVENK